MPSATPKSPAIGSFLKAEKSWPGREPSWAMQPTWRSHGRRLLRLEPNNQTEIDRGWIMKANTIEELANILRADSDNSGLMSSHLLRATLERYNECCRKGEDLDFHKPKEWLIPLEDPPYYAVKLWPGGPNTQGGPKRNARGQVLRVDNTPVPRLDPAGEMGSFWGMVYHGGAILGMHCIWAHRGNKCFG